MLIDDDFYETSFGTVVGQPYWIGEHAEKQSQNATVTELSAIDNPHEAEACCFPDQSLIFLSPFYRSDFAVLHF